MFKRLWNPLPLHHAIKVVFYGKSTSIISAPGILESFISVSDHEVFGCLRRFPPVNLKNLTLPFFSSYPADENSSILNTLVMLDADNNNRLHWLIVNIPGAK